MLILCKKHLEDFHCRKYLKYCYSSSNKQMRLVFPRPKTSLRYFPQDEVLNTQPQPPFWWHRESNDQVTSLALGVHDGKRNINRECPIDTHFLGIREWAVEELSRAKPCAGFFTTFREQNSHSKPGAGGSFLFR